MLEVAYLLSAARRPLRPRDGGGEPEGAENDAGILLPPGRSFALVVLLEGEEGGAAAPLRVLRRRGGERGVSVLHWPDV
jgi:hypothetical protein